MVDRYGDYLVLQVGSAVERRLDWVLDALEERRSPAGVLLRGDSAARKRKASTPQYVCCAEVPETVVVREGPVRYEADLWRGRRAAVSWTSARTTSPPGATPEVQAACLTSSATRADSPCTPRAKPGGRGRGLERPALEAARRNAELNDLDTTFTRVRAFDLLRERSDAGKGYDMVILDPPAFAKTRRDLPRARRAYKEINLRAMKPLNPLASSTTCSCSYHLSREPFEDTLRSAAGDAARVLRVREWRGQAADHRRS